MSDEKSQQQTSTESTVAGAAKTGKAISNIAKGAAAGGAHGAAIEAGKSSAKWLIPLIAAVLLPLILVAMLPSIIFGSLLGDGTDSPNGISNDEVLPSAQHLRSSEAACPRELASVLLLAPLGKRHEFFAFDPHFLFREPNAGPPSVRYLE